MPDAFGYDWSLVLETAAVLVLLGLVLTAVYRTMDHPRLPLVREEDRLPKVTWIGVLVYLLTIPFLVVFWYVSLLSTLLIAASTPVAGQIAMMAVAVIVATRFLAHLSRPTAHEVGKVIPIAVLGVIIIGNTSVDLEQLADVLQSLSDNADQLGTYIVIELVADVVITAAWYLGILARTAGVRTWRGRTTHRHARRARAQIRQIRTTGQTVAVAEASNQETGQPDGGPVGERSRAEVAAAAPTAAAAGETVVGETARQRQALDVDLVPEQTSDDTDASWGGGSDRSGSGADGDDLRRFLDERPPHHGS